MWDNLRKLLIFNLPVNFAQGFTIFFGEMLRVWEVSCGRGCKVFEMC